MQRSVFIAMVAFWTSYDIIKLYLFFPKIVKSYIPLKRGNFVHNLLSKTVKEKYSVLKVFFLVLLFFGANVFLSFSTDSYSTLSAGFHTAAQDMLERNGRPIIALIYKLHSLSGLPGISFYYISSGLALLFLGIAVWLYQKLPVTVCRKTSAFCWPLHPLPTSILLNISCSLKNAALCLPFFSM